MRLTPDLLAGRFVFLSASVPAAERDARFLQRRAAAVRVQDAVVSLVDAVIRSGGSLVFGGHPSISPLVAMAALGSSTGNRRSADSPTILIYQSEAYRKAERPDAAALLRSLPFVKEVWTDAVAGEEFDPSVRGRPQCVRSLAEMRDRMIRETNPIAMVAVGGMEGILDEAQRFRSLTGNPIYPLASTGGASALLKNEFPGLHEPDASLATDLGTSYEGEDASPPYALIMNRLVARMADTP